MSEPPRPAHAEPITRWYREPYAWMVFGLPAAVVLACAVTIVIAVRTADGLVVAGVPSGRLGGARWIQDATADRAQRGRR